MVTTITSLASRVDNRTVTDRIQTDLRTGAAVFPTSYNRDRKTGIDTWTDCLVLEIATLGHKDLVSALTRAEYIGHAESGHACDRLSAKVGGAPSSEQPHISDYWQYWWGSASLLNIAIGTGGMNLPAYQAGLKFSLYIIIVLIGITASIRYRRAAWPLFPVIVALIFGFGIPLFGQSIAHAPGLVTGMLLLLVYMVAGIDRAAPGRQFVYLSSAGGLVFYSDLMNGDLVAVLICFAFIQLLSIQAFGPPKSIFPERLRSWPISIAIVSLMTAFFTGAVSMALLRILLRAALLQQNLFTVISEWLADLAKHASYNWVDRSEYQSESPLETLYRCYYNIDVGTYPYIGRHGTVLTYALCALLYLVICVWAARRSGKLAAGQRDTLLAAALIVMVIPAWYGVFAVHTMIHFWMTGRLLALFFALAPSLALLLMNMRRPRAAIITRSPSERGAAAS